MTAIPVAHTKNRRPIRVTIVITKCHHAHYKDLCNNKAETLERHTPHNALSKYIPTHIASAIVEIETNLATTHKDTTFR